MKVNHLNALLVEIMMAVLFFALSAAVILELFTAAHGRSTEARLSSEALGRVRNLTERLCAADDPGALLESEGFEAADALWRMDAGEYVLTVDVDFEETGAGALMRAEVAAAQEGGVLISLPCAKYIPGEVAP